MKKNSVNIIFLLFFAAAVTIVCSGHNVYAENPPQEQEPNCTKKCHKKMLKEKFVHGPISAGECKICHGESPKHAKKPKKYKFGDVKEVDKRCFECHDQFEARKFIHNPVEEGECIACHSPHGSPYKFQLLGEGGTVCFNCHDEDMVAGKFVHGPAAVGGCVACHEPHTSDYEKNLRAEEPTLCFMCHTDQADAFHNAKVIHKPVAEKCTNCHNPHSSEKQFMLGSDAPDLCFECHKEKKKYIDTATVKHGALMTGKSCLNCHEPHVSNIAKRLSMAPMDLCLSCHDKPVEATSGEILTNMKKLLTENKDHHGPIRQKDCSGCHDPHGSDVFRILRKPYPSSFYMSFQTKNYNLCFNCHEKAIVQNPETTKLTNFRNAEINLHFKHVNKPEKGRTCRACHETHASNHPKHIRESVPFGTWELPINFQKTKTGGSCTPGCHKLKKYDRVKKEFNE